MTSSRASGWAVYALDADEGALRRLEKGVEAEAFSRLHTCVVGLNSFPELPAVDLIYAGYALPYTTPACFQGIGIRSPGPWRLAP
jgi:hypothetical protein